MPFPHVSKKINAAKLHAEVKAALGINLMAENENDTVHGHISTLSKPAGQPFCIVNNVPSDVCPMCDVGVPRADGHECSEVILYESDETPGKNHKSNIVRHGLDASKKAALVALVQGHQP